MKSILINVGTRPEVIKMAPVIDALKRRDHDQVRCVLCLTGQQRELARQMLADFGLQPDIDLDVMTAGQTPIQVVALLLNQLTQVIADVRPDMVLAQGDTSTVLASAMTAAYAKVDFGHVEAGLRTGDFGHPFPEEYHRRVAAVSAKWHFAPTSEARANLLAEGITPDAIHLVGNTVVDALRQMKPIAQQRPMPEVIDPMRRTILLTAHRRESHGTYLESCFQAIRDAVGQRRDVQVIYPVHPNPNVRGSADAIFKACPQITTCEPLSYLDMMALMHRAALIVTDSGGIQEEAACLGIPTMVIREATERLEGMEDGPLLLVGNKTGLIQYEIQQLLDDPKYHAKRSRATTVFGDGTAALKIADVLLSEDHATNPERQSLAVGSLAVNA